MEQTNSSRVLGTQTAFVLITSFSPSPGGNFSEAGYFFLRKNYQSRGLGTLSTAKQFHQAQLPSGKADLSTKFHQLRSSSIKHSYKVSIRDPEEAIGGLVKAFAA
ncbi:MAG: hypothetical protein H8E51_11015 [Bacteroidetes bacterium]|nr:hypothetical protein [Bacteroidota bacterium]